MKKSENAMTALSKYRTGWKQVKVYKKRFKKLELLSMDF